MQNRIMSVIVPHLIGGDIKEKDIRLTTCISDTYMDSLDYVELTFDLEKEFSMKVSSREWELLFNNNPKLTVGDIVRFVEQKCD